MNKAELIRHEIEKRKVHNLAIGNPLFAAMAEEDIELLSFIDSMQEEPVSGELEEAAKKYGNKEHPMTTTGANDSAHNFKAGAKWQKNNLWKPADGDDLPDIDREVIALLDNGKVVFAHRPPEYWDGKDIVTGKVTRNYPKTYDKGGWNIPNVKWWLDCSLPNMED